LTHFSFSISSSIKTNGLCLSTCTTPVSAECRLSLDVAPVAAFESLFSVVGLLFVTSVVAISQLLDFTGSSQCSSTTNQKY